MQIDKNPIEMEAMKYFHLNETEKAQELQKQFIAQFIESVQAGEDYCPCKWPCEYHKKCLICLTLHRGHGDHLPVCMQAMLNERLVKLSELTEHSVKELLIPDEGDGN